jgi:hypothetical protein
MLRVRPPPSIRALNTEFAKALMIRKGECFSQPHEALLIALNIHPGLKWPSQKDGLKTPCQNPDGKLANAFSLSS